MAQATFDFLTQILGWVVVNAQTGARLGVIRDLVATIPAEPDVSEDSVLPDAPRTRETPAARDAAARLRLPRVVAIVMTQGKTERVILSGGLRPGETPGQWVTASEPATYTPDPQDLFLKRDVLDKQIVDTLDFRVVRASDVRLAPAPDGSGDLLVMGVDPGETAVLRRLLPGTWGERVARLLHLPTEGRFIAWSDVEPTTQAENGVLRLRTSRDKISELHPADIADILEQMTPADRTAVLESLDTETAAEALTEADDDVQRDILLNLDTEDAADILEQMDPDDAADAMGDLPGSRRKELLDEMEDAEADDVRQLLAYDDDTAGGLMTTEFVSLPLDWTADAAIAHLREIAPRAETIYYIYVTDPEGRLAGVISLRDLIIAAPQTPLWNFMVENVVRIGLDDNLEQVASALDHYDLLAVPVTDNDNRLQGIVTVDDTLEQLLPASWRRRRFRARRNNPEPAHR